MFVRIAVINGVDNVAKLKNDNQEKFCHEFIKTGNQTQAAINAGYSKKSAKSTASRMMTYDDFKHIPERIEELISKSSKRNKLIADAEEVLEFFSNTFRNQLKAKQLNTEGKTVEIDINVETRDRLKAAELLGKKYAMFTEKVEHSGKITNEIEVLTDADIDKELKELEYKAKREKIKTTKRKKQKTIKK